MVEHELVLLFGDGAGEVSPTKAAGLVGRVLVHDGEVDVVAGEVPHAVEHVERVVHVARQDEVAHDDALQHAAVVAELAPSPAGELEKHLGQRRARDLRVVGGAGEPAGERRACVLEVGEPDVDDLPEQLDGPHRLVAAGVADDGQVHASGAHHADGLDHLRGEVPGRHEVDVERALAGKLEHDLRQAPHAHLVAEVARADLGVLAEDAAQGAAGEEDGARPGLARDGRLLPIVQGGAGHTQLVIGPAGTAATQRAGRAAAARAKAAALVGAMHVFHAHPSPRRAQTRDTKRAGHVVTRSAVPGGDEGNRTLGLCHATAALSQLSYVPRRVCALVIVP